MPTVQSLLETFEGRRGAEDDRGRRQLTRVFRVQFDSINVGVSYALYAQGLPQRFDRYEGPGEADEGSRAVRRNAVQDSNDPFWWTVTIEYDSISSDPALSTQAGGAGGQGGSPTNENPTLDPPDIQWGANHDSKAIRLSKDANPKVIANSAKQPFQPKPTVDYHRQTITYSRNESTTYYDGIGLSEYWDKVNTSVYQSFGARTLKFSYHTAALQYRNHRAYWRVTYYFERRSPDWDFHLLDEGVCSKRTLANGDIEYTPTMKSGLPTGVKLLDGEGRVLASNSPLIATGVYLDFRAYSQFEFTELELTWP